MCLVFILFSLSEECKCSSRAIKPLLTHLPLSLALLRPDFDKLTEKLKKTQKASLVDKVLNEFLIEKDMGIIETRIYHPTDGKKGESTDASDEKKKKKKERKEKKEKKELEKQEKKEKKAKKEHKYLTLHRKSNDKLPETNNHSDVSPQASVSLSKATSKSPLKVIKKFGTLRPGKSFLKDLSHSSKEKTRPNLPDFKHGIDCNDPASSSHEEEAKSLSNANSLENHLTEPVPVRESHLI